MSTVGSDEHFLRFYESYARAPRDELNMSPKEPGDFRERVERETIRGRYGVFHQTIEQYFNRHWRAATVPRFGVFWLASFGLMQHSLVSFYHTFPNLATYPRFSAHPNYKLLGPIYAWFHLLRPVVWTYVFIRMTRGLVSMAMRHYQGKDDLHVFWYSDSNYPDMLHDEEDMRYINFRYTDQKVSPDPLTGYYPYDNLKYGKWLDKKGDQYRKTKADQPRVQFN